MQPLLSPLQHISFGPRFFCFHLHFPYFIFLLLSLSLRFLIASSDLSSPFICFLKMGHSDRVRLRLPDGTRATRHSRNDRLAAETKPSLGFRRGMKRGIIGMSPDAKRREGVAMEGFVKDRCLLLMETLIDHPYGEVFRDISTLASIPTHGSEYVKQLTKPMDLSTIKSGLEKGDYSAVEGFVGDVRLVFSNALMFFPVDNDVHAMAKRMSRDSETELKNAMSEMKTNTEENIAAVVSYPDERAERPVRRQRLNDSAKDKSPIKSPKTVLENTGATPPRVALLKERFKETILKAEISLFGMGGERKLTERKRKREREAARVTLKKMEKLVMFNDIEDHKAVEELEYFCGHPLSDSLGRKVLSGLGLRLKDEACELD